MALRWPYSFGTMIGMLDGIKTFIMKQQNISCAIGSALLMFAFVYYSHALLAQPSAVRKQILVDVAHGQKFWNDPSAMAEMDTNMVARIKYMNGELVKNATSLNADVHYVKGNITPDLLAKSNILFVHIPSAKYSTDEVKAIKQYLLNGGSLFVVMDSDYWSTLEQTNVNDLLGSTGIKFGGPSPVEKSGGHTKAGLMTEKGLPIPYHGARLLEGGTPFCFNNQTEEHPFGTYIDLKKGGKIIAMGDGMVSLYMTSWEGVDNYQCSEFMHDAFAWLLK